MGVVKGEAEAVRAGTVEVGVEGQVEVVMEKEKEEEVVKADWEGKKV